MSIDIWIPSLFESKGGIQTYSAYLLAAMQAIAPDRYYRVFLKHDAPKHLPAPSAANTTYFPSGQIPLKLRTPAFAWELARAGLLAPAELVISTHLNFSPVVKSLERLRPIPYWLVAHGIDAWNISNPKLLAGIKGADLLVAVSHYTRDRLLAEQDLDPDRVVVLPNTFDSDRFQIGPKPIELLEKYQLSPSQPVILTISRLWQLDSYKGYDRIIEALPQIRQVIPDVRYIIVGKGDDRSRIEALIERLELQECVTLAGFIPDEELAAYYQLCDVFAMPSKGEGFGIVYLEALGCGKPCLGGDRDGAVDALCHGKLGALVDPDDVGAVARSLIQILQGTYPNELMYQPQLLRQQAIDIYGFDRFKQTLSDLFERWQQQKQTTIRAI